MADKVGEFKKLKENNDNMSAIKLYQLEKNRFQSQLYVGRKTVDFIIEDGIMKCWGYGNKGFDFYEYKEPYIIVKDKIEMNIQSL